MRDYNIWRDAVTPKRQWFGQESHLSALQSTSADKHSGCKSNTLRPGKPTATVETPLMNLITGLLKQQASYFASANKTFYCPQAVLLSALQRIVSQLAFVFIMLEASSHCAVGPFQCWIRPMGIFAKSQRSVTFLVIPPTHTCRQRALFLFSLSCKLWQKSVLKFSQLKEAQPCESNGGPVSVSMCVCDSAAVFTAVTGKRMAACSHHWHAISTLKESIKWSHRRSGCHQWIRPLWRETFSINKMMVDLYFPPDAGCPLAHEVTHQQNQHCHLTTTSNITSESLLDN